MNAFYQKFVCLNEAVCLRAVFFDSIIFAEQGFLLFAAEFIHYTQQLFSSLDGCFLLMNNKG